MAGGLSLIPYLLDQIDGEEPDAEVDPGADHYGEAWGEQAVADINCQLEERSKDIWSVHDQHYAPTDRDYIGDVRVTYHNNGEDVVQEELREVLAVPMKEPRVQTLEHVIGKFNDIEVVQVPRKILAWVVQEILRFILRAQEVLM